MLRSLSRAALPLALPLALALAFAATPSLGAQLPPGAPTMMQAPDALHAPGQNVTITLLTMGPGEQVWELFGHAAIMIRDNTTGRDTVFNWGVFNSAQPNFILHFLKGLMLYQMGGESEAQVLADYRYFNRTVVAQELDLTTAQKDSLLHLIQINARPENLEYRYDYYRDNCSTRPRDLLDQVTGGLLHRGAMQVSDRSYRWHTLRLMQGDKLLVVGVDIGLGEPADRPARRWDEMFLPSQLHDVVATLRVRDSSGTERPFVVSDRVLYQASRPPEPKAPPVLGPWLWIIGLLVAAAFWWVGDRAVGGTRGARVTAGVVFAVWSLLAGLLGTVLTILWTLTDHVFAHANENLLLFNPLWLVFAVLVALFYVGRRAATATQLLAPILAGLGVVALLAHLLLSRQSNLAVIGLGLPPMLAIADAVRREFMARQSAAAPLP